MCTRWDYMYKERSKTTKFIDFVNLKVQKRSQFIIILALIFQVSVLIQQIFNFLPFNFCPIGSMENVMRAVPSHPWKSHSHGQAWILQLMFYVTRISVKNDTSEKQRYTKIPVILVLIENDIVFFFEWIFRNGTNQLVLIRSATRIY